MIAGFSGFIVILGALGIVLTNGVKAPEEFPNLLAGSFTDGGRFSTGNTLPLVGRPWGFNHWAPQTRHAGRSTGSWWFSGNEQMFTWLRCTHQPSPWIGDWGNFLFTPLVGDAVRDPVHFWQPRSAVLKPYLFDAVVAPYNIRMELTPTDHAAYLRVTFPASADYGTKRVCFSDLQWDNNGESLQGGGYMFDAHTNNVHSERFVVNAFSFRVRAESPEAAQVERVQDMMCFKFRRDATVVTVRIGTSLISARQAELNLQREIPKDKSFDTILAESKDVWHQMMSRVNVLDAGEVGDMAEKHLTIFYTGLYRALTFPRRLDEIDAQGNVVHYSPYDPQGGVHPGYLVTDNGFWDTFRTVYPLLSLAYPDHLGPIIQGNAQTNGGVIMMLTLIDALRGSLAGVRY